MWGSRHTLGISLYEAAICSEDRAQDTTCVFVRACVKLTLFGNVYIWVASMAIKTVFQDIYALKASEDYQNVSPQSQLHFQTMIIY
jgi:hypothetical protein